MFTLGQYTSSAGVPHIKQPEYTPFELHSSHTALGRDIRQILQIRDPLHLATRPFPTKPVSELVFHFPQGWPSFATFIISFIEQSISSHLYLGEEMFKLLIGNAANE